MRQPYETLIFPYRRYEKEVKFAIFLRSDMKIWQGICGGGEEGETILETAKREAYEEAGINYTSDYIQLDTMTTIPITSISSMSSLKGNIYVVKEYCFGVDAMNQEIKLSDEHIEYRWLTYSEAKELLKWDSDKTALWELNERLTRTKHQ